MISCCGSAKRCEQRGRSSALGSPTASSSVIVRCSVSPRSAQAVVRTQPLTVYRYRDLTPRGARSLYPTSVPAPPSLTVTHSHLSGRPKAPYDRARDASLRRRNRDRLPINTAWFDLSVWSVVRDSGNRSSDECAECAIALILDS